MLKAQDIVLLIKIIAIGSSEDRRFKWSQHELATHLCMSASEVSAGFKRLKQAALISQLNVATANTKLAVGQYYVPNMSACEELLISGVKYFFPGVLGEYTRGIATSYAAPLFRNQITLGEDPIPVWPYAEGNARGLALEPLYSSVPASITKYPDEIFYELLVLVDAIRQGRARERNLAIKILQKRFKHNE